MMKRLNTLVSAVLLGLCAASEAQAYSGKVYADTNGNGRHDKGEKVLGNVMVSDGLNVTKTLSDGTYSLPGHARERFLFVSMPSGYKATRYYHPIEKSVEHYDFALQPYEAHVRKDGAHSFVHISDTEISSAVGQEDWVNDLRNYAWNEQAAFIVHTGDICYEKGLKAHKPMMNDGNMDLPVYYCIGNHDLVNGKYGEELFEKIYGPVYYSFNVGKMHYIVTPMWGGDYRPGYTKEDVYHWLKNDLAQLPKGTPVVFFNHDYWTTGDRHIFSAGSDKTIDLDAHNLKAWIYGHWHINYITRHGKALAICTSTPARGGIDHATSAFRTLHVDKQGNLKSELRYTYIDRYLEIASVQNGQTPVRADGELDVSVNAYATVATADKVLFSCWVGQKEILSDKAMIQTTDFNWRGKAKLPEKYRGRTVTLKAKAYFHNGEVAVQEKYFTFAADSLPAGTSTDWANLAGNARHVGISKDTVALPFALAWSTNIGSNIYMSSPIVYKNKVYAASVDENAQGKAAVVAMNAADGTVVWKYATRASVKNTIAGTQGLIFAQDVYGYLYALDAESGKLVWEKKLDVAYIPSLNDGIVASGERVFAGSGKGLCALDARTGTLLWQNTGWAQREGTTATLSLSADEKVLIGGVQWGAMYANDADNGQLLWGKSENGIRNRASSPAMFEGLMYFLSLKSLFVLSPSTGEILFEKELPYSVDVTSTPLVTDEEIIFGTAENGLVALDRHNWTEKWKFRTGKALIYTAPYVNGEAAQIECSPVLSGDMVLVGASDGALYGINRHDGSLMWSHKVGAPIMTTMAVSGNMFFAADFAGNIYGFKGK